jgi:hypothetical protein
LLAAGIASDASSSPRQLALQVLTKHGSDAQAWHDWLLQLEALRYARADLATGQSSARLMQLKKQLRRLSSHLMSSDRASR